MALYKLHFSIQWQKSRSTWLKKGGANSFFFFFSMGWCLLGDGSTVIISINVKGVQIKGVEGARSVAFQHFQSNFKVAMESRPGLGDLSFKTISMKDVADLIIPFLLEEIEA